MVVEMQWGTDCLWLCQTQIATVQIDQVDTVHRALKKVSQFFVRQIEKKSFYVPMW